MLVRTQFLTTDAFIPAPLDTLVFNVGLPWLHNQRFWIWQCSFLDLLQFHSVGYNYHRSLYCSFQLILQ